MNEGQILNFYKDFSYKNVVMNFKISGFVGSQDNFIIFRLYKGNWDMMLHKNFLYKS